MESFIKVDYVPRHLITFGSDRLYDKNLEIRSTYIRLDAFMQVDVPEEYKLYKEGYSEEIIRTLKISHCYLSRIMGLGINGVTTDIYLTEESYNKICFALGLN